MATRGSVKANDPNDLMEFQKPSSIPYGGSDTLGRPAFMVPVRVNMVVFLCDEPKSGSIE